MVEGIIRRVDDLGRITLPKDVRRKLKISDGTLLEITADNEKIILRKYDNTSSIRDRLQELQTSLYEDEAIIGVEKIAASQDLFKKLMDIFKE